MPNWKKIIVSGSDAALNTLNVTTNFTASGIKYPSTDGIDGQYLKTDGLGNLVFENVSNTAISIKNVSGDTIPKGTPCYITASGVSGNVAGVVPADAGSSSLMPAGVIAGETLADGVEGIGLINGFINGVNTSLFQSGEEVFVAVGGGYTNVAPTGSALIQKLGNIEKVDASNGSGVITGPGASRSVPNINPGFTWVGNTDWVATATATSSLSVASASVATSASYALTASFALNGGGTVNTGSLLTTASVSLNTITFTKGDGSTFPITVDTGSGGGGGAAFPFSGSAVISGSLFVSSSTTNVLTIQGSGSAQPIFTVQGSAGQLFAITDSLSGSLFSVNDISGLPILEVFSDNTILLGDYQAPTLYTTKRVTSIAGNNVIYSLATSSYDGAFFDYVAKSGSNARAGNIMALWSGTSVNFTETTTTDFGDTSGLAFTAFISGSNLVLSGSTTTANWNIKTIIRSI